MAKAQAGQHKQTKAEAAAIRKLVRPEEGDMGVITILADDFFPGDVGKEFAAGDEVIDTDQDMANRLADMEKEPVTFSVSYSDGRPTVLYSWDGKDTLTRLSDNVKTHPGYDGDSDNAEADLLRELAKAGM